MDDWIEQKDPKTGRKFYYNKKLRQTAWQKPTGSSQEAGAWERRIDKNTGDVYYYNTITQVRSISNPVPTSKTLSNETPELQKQMQREESNRLRTATRENFVQNDSLGTLSVENVRSSLRKSLKLPDLMLRHSESIENSTTSRRYVSVKLNQLGPLVRDRAPGEDAFAKLRAMRKNHADTETGPKLDIATLAESSKQKKRVQISAPTYEQYAQSNFHVAKRMFGQRQTIEELTYHSSKPLKRGLHKLSTPALDKKATQVSKLIHSFAEQPNVDVMGVYKILVSLLNIAMTDSPQELRDEIFCQIMKNISRNPRPECTFKSWQLLCLCCGAFPPSSTLEPTLRKFIDAELNNNLEGQANMILAAPTESERLTIGAFATYARLRLDKSIEVGQRSQIPCREEVDCVMRRKPVTVSIFLVNDAEIKMEVDTWTTVGDLRRQLAEHLSIKDVSIFSLLEVSDDEKEYTLPLEDRVLDVLADWEIELLGHKRPDIAPQNRFLFRIRLFFPVDVSDERAVELAYYQAVYDVTDGRYPTLEADLVRLVALQGQEKFGDSSQHENDPFGTDEEFAEFIPESFHESLTDIRRQALVEYDKLNGVSQQEAMERYLEIVQEWSFYGAQIYPVNPLNNPEFPKSCFIAINAKAVYIIDPTMKKFLAEFSWDKIVTWGYSDRGQPGIQRRYRKHMEDSFCLIMGNFLQQTKLFFQTEQAVEVYKLVEAYGNRIKGYKSLKE